MAADLHDELHPPLSQEEALVEADRCLACGGAHAPAPCVVACPADVDVPSFVAALARGDAEGAARTIFQENLLGASCARVCPAEVLCEGACVLEHERRRPVSVAALQRHATEWALARELAPRRPAPPSGKRVAVVGAGPAGLACAGELAALGHAVTVYDERNEPGGLVRYAIAPYRIERDPLPAEARMLERLGVELRLGVHVGALEELDADAVFVAVGLGDDAQASLPGGELPGVWNSLDFVAALKTGSTPEVGERVVVVGGGNTAIDVAREALLLGAREATLLYRRTAAEMPAYPHEVTEARAAGVRFQWLTIPVRFLGKRRLEAVECRYARLGEPDASGRRRPEEVHGTEFAIPVDTAVMAIGQRLRESFGLALERGRIAVGAGGETSAPLVFAGGDATNGGATAVEAVREAKLAARAIHEALS